MKSGIELIAQERQEQIEKHGWTLEHDTEHKEGELRLAAMYAINPHPDELKGIRLYRGWEWFTEKIDAKREVERLIIAATLIAAEIDRLNKIQPHLTNSTDTILINPDGYVE